MPEVRESEGDNQLAGVLVVMSPDLTAAAFAHGQMMREIEYRLRGLPKRWSLAVQWGFMPNVPDGPHSLRCVMQELPPGGKPFGAGEWTIYGPMTAEARWRATVMGPL